MKIETYENGSFQVLRINENDHTISELAELEDLISGYLERGKNKIAVSFSDARYIYSGAIRVLITCHRMVSDDGGKLCIIEPDPHLFDALELLNVDQVIEIFVSEKYLPQPEDDTQKAAQTS